MKPESEEKQSIYPSTFLRVRVTFRHGAEGSRNQTPTALAWHSLRQQVRCPNLGAPLGKMSRMPGRFFIKHDSQAKTKNCSKMPVYISMRWVTFVQIAWALRQRRAQDCSFPVSAQSLTQITCATLPQKTQNLTSVRVRRPNIR